MVCQGIDQPPEGPGDHIQIAVQLKILGLNQPVKIHQIGGNVIDGCLLGCQMEKQGTAAEKGLYIPPVFGYQMTDSLDLPGLPPGPFNDRIQKNAPF
jgi:lipopolysaccharide export system protein LptA